MDTLKIEAGADSLLACRICLTWEGKLFNITEWGLDQVFVELMGTTLSAWDGLPQHLCGLCRAQLVKAQALRTRCQQAERLLKQALMHQHFITNSYIHTIDRSAHKLTYNLNNCLTTAIETCVHEDIDTAKPDIIKDELDIETDMIELDVLEFKPDSNNDEFVWPDDNGIDINDIQVDSITVSSNIDTTDVNEDLEDTKPLKYLKERIKKSKKQKLTKKNKFSTEEDFKEFEEKYEFHVKCLTEEEMVDDMERRKQSEKYLLGEFKCELCYRGFSTANAFDNHIKDKHDPNIGPNECHLCHARYRFAVNRNQHVQDAHRLQFRCRRCELLVPGEPHAVEHAAGHAGATFKCRHCDKQFLKKTTCATHMRLDHPVENAAGGSCEVCGETFISRTGLNCHKTRAHNKPYNPKLHCRKCRVQFDSSDALQRHKLNRPDNRCDPHGRRQRTSDRTLCTPQQWLEAKKRIDNGESKRAVARSLGMSESTLRMRLKRTSPAKSLGRYSQTFPPKMELELCELIKKSETYKNIREVAFEFAEKNGLEHRFNRDKKMAGSEWLRLFIKRHPELR